MVITFTILVLSVVHTETIAPLGVAISVFLTAFTSRIDKKIRKDCSENFKHLAPVRTSSAIQLLNTCLMITFVFSNPFTIGIVTDAKYSILWGFASGIMLLTSFNRLNSISRCAKKMMQIDSKDQKSINKLKYYHSSVSIMLALFIIASVFAKFKLLPCLLIINQVHVTFFANKEIK